MIVSDATISGNHGSDGGGIFTDGMLTLSDSVLSGNFAGSGGGIFNSSTLTMSDSVLSSNAAPDGGGLHNSGFATVLDSSISSNAEIGIRNNGTLTLSNSTVFGNLSSDFGAGIRNAGTLTMSNCTLSGNEAALIGGGIFNSSGSVTMSSSTIAANIAGDFGGGIENLAPFISRNSIVADNLPDNCAEPVTPSGVNFATDATCGLPVVTSAQLNLGPLASNGGPTQTHALLGDSVAIDAAPDCTDAFGSPVTIDQRGMPRPQDGDGDQVAVCDVGAFEASELTLLSGFDAELELSQRSGGNARFFGRGSFAPDSAGNGVDLVAEPVVLFLADLGGRFFEQILPPGSFERTERGYLFRGLEGAGGIRWLLVARDAGTGFTFELHGKTRQGSGAGQPPVIVSLQIGDDVGSDTLPCVTSPGAMVCR